jgi:type II secretory pathway component PulF
MDGSFGYRAQLASGRELTGTLNAADQAAALTALEALQLKVLELWPAGAPTRTRPLGTEDFKSFNQQLALLVKSGLPLETGLQLLAAEAPRGRRSSVLSAISADLQAGMTLPQAVEKHRSEFPADYARLLEAGIRTNNLSEVLINLGNHLDLRQKLQEALIGALAYPVCLVIALLGVLTFMGLEIFPRYQRYAAQWMSNRRHVFGFSADLHNLPFLTRAVLFCGLHTPLISIILAAAALVMLLFWPALRNRPAGLHVRDWLALHVPLIGPALRAGLVARWCDGLKIGITSGMDIPESIGLASSITSSPVISADGREMAETISHGMPISAVRPGQMLPATLPASVRSGIVANNLPDTLATISESYRRQAEIRFAMLPAVVAPVALVIIGIILFVVIYGMAMPLFDLFRSIWAYQ